MNKKLVLEIVLETLGLVEAKTPAELAHELGLTHVGYGYWANEKGETVARTIKGELVKLEKPTEIPDEADDDAYDDDSTDTKYDSHTESIIQAGEKAIEKLAKHALDYMDVEDFDHAVIRPSIRRLIAYDEIYIHPLAKRQLDEDELESLEHYLKMLQQNKTSKLVKAVQIYNNSVKWQGKKVGPKTSQKTKPEPQVEPEPELKKPSTTTSSDGENYVGNINVEKASDLTGITPDHEKFDVFIDLLKQADEAISTAQLNYVRAKFKSADFFGEGDNAGKGTKTWDAWKGLLKYIKSTKDQPLIKGAINKGKIKGNKEAVKNTNVDEKTLEVVAREATDKYLDIIHLDNIPSKYRKALEHIFANALTLPPGEVNILDTGWLDKVPHDMSFLFDEGDLNKFNEIVNTIREKHPQFIKQGEEVQQDGPPVDKPSPDTINDIDKKYAKTISKAVVEFFTDLGLVYAKPEHHQAVGEILVDLLENPSQPVHELLKDKKIPGIHQNIMGPAVAYINKALASIYKKHPELLEKTLNKAIVKTDDYPGLKKASDDEVKKETKNLIDEFNSYPEEIRHATHEVYNKFLLELVNQNPNANDITNLWTAQVKLAIAKAIKSENYKPIFDLEKSGIISGEEMDLIDVTLQNLGYKLDLFDKEPETSDDLETPESDPDNVSADDVISKLVIMGGPAVANVLGNTTPEQFKKFSDAFNKAVKADTFEEFTNSFKNSGLEFTSSQSETIEKALTDYWNKYHAKLPSYEEVESQLENLPIEDKNKAFDLIKSSIGTSTFIDAPSNKILTTLLAVHNALQTDGGESMIDHMNSLEGILTDDEIKKLSNGVFQAIRAKNNTSSIEEPSTTSADSSTNPAKSFENFLDAAVGMWKASVDADEDSSPIPNPKVEDKLHNAYLDMMKSGDPTNFNMTVEQLYEDGYIGWAFQNALMHWAKEALKHKSDVAPEQTSNPLESWTPEGKTQLSAQKAANTLMNNEKNNGDPENALAWIEKKFHENESAGKNTNAFKFMAMALVKNHGLDPDKVPSFLVPDDLKDLFNKSKSHDPQEDEPDVSIDEPENAPDAEELDFDSAVDTFDQAFQAFEKGEEWSPDTVNEPDSEEYSNKSSLDPEDKYYSPPTTNEVDDKVFYNKIQKLKGEIAELEKEKKRKKDDPNKYAHAADTLFEKFVDDNPAYADLFKQNEQHIKNAMAEALKEPSWQDMKNKLAPALTEKLKGGADNPNGIKGFTYEMYEALKNHMKSTLNVFIQGGSEFDIEISNKQKEIEQLLKSKEEAHSMKNLPNFDDGIPDGETNDPIDERMKRVFANWAIASGFGIGNLPNQGGDGERNKVMKAVKRMLEEPNPKSVLTHATHLYQTSLNSDQIKSLLNQVHREKKFPGSIISKKGSAPSKPVSPPKQDTPKKKSKDIVGGIMTRNKIPSEKRDEVRKILSNALNNVEGEPIGTVVWNVRYALMNDTKLPYDTANKLAKWVDKKLKDGYELPDKPKTKHGGIPKLNANFITQQDVPQGIDDPHNLVYRTLVEGEKILVHHGKSGRINWALPEGANSDVYDEDTVSLGQQQHQWRMKHFSHEFLQKFEHLANSWQGSGQWSHAPSVRKEYNTVFTQMIEGEPPAVTKVKDCLERGMVIPQKDLETYLEGFKIGELVYLGPCGFSERKKIARNPPGQGPANVLLRVYPREDGTIKGLRLHDRPSDVFKNEKEVILGTSRNTRVLDVIKHINVDEYGTYHVGVEIILQQVEDGITEAINNFHMKYNKYGFLRNGWSGLSKDTIKAFIKYHNCSVNTKW